MGDKSGRLQKNIDRVWMPFIIRVDFASHYCVVECDSLTIYIDHRFYHYYFCSYSHRCVVWENRSKIICFKGLMIRDIDQSIILIKKQEIQEIKFENKISRRKRLPTSIGYTK